MCLQLGIDDPEAWLDTAEDRVLRLWEAYWQVEPWGMDWHRHGNQMVMLDAIYAATVNPNLPKGKRHDVRDMSSFMPGEFIDPQKARRGKRAGIRKQLDNYVKAFKRGNHD